MAVSSTYTLTANTAQNVTQSAYFTFIVVDNSGDSSEVTPAATSQAEIYVRLDGSVATVGGSGCLQVPFGQTRVFYNGLSLPNSNVASGSAKYNSLYDGASDQSEAIAWTAQQGWQGTNFTHVSIISAGAPVVTVTFE